MTLHEANDTPKAHRCCQCRSLNNPCTNCKCAKAKTPCTNCFPGQSTCANPFSTAPVSPLPPPEDETFNFKWGNISGNDVVSQINLIFEQVVHWRRNIFMPPSGNATKSMMQEMVTLIKAWNDNTDLGKISLKMLMIMPALLLQKPFRKSKSRDHGAALKRRLETWREGKFLCLLSEGKTIQKRLSSNQRTDNAQVQQRFSTLMREGKVNQANRLLSSNAKSGILDLTDETMKAIEEKHPEGKEADPEALLNGPEDQPVHAVVFDDIDATAIRTAAQKMNGAAGPSGLDSYGWKKLLCNSKQYGLVSDDLCQEIATMAKKMCTESVENLEAVMACRLIPLDKNPGLRPIGIGEVLRRIIGKSVMVVLKEDIGEAAGNLQMCAGKPAGSEAAIHALKDIFGEEDAEAAIMVDATNAFNLLNRQVLLHNVKITCPSLATFTQNTYSKSSRIFVSGGKEVSSDEGITQGDAMAMGLYSIGITPLLEEAAAKKQFHTETLDLKHQNKQVAFADDINASGNLEGTREYWDKIASCGPKYGYFPKASKSWLIVKPQYEEKARELFSDTEVQITTSGQKHLGAALGSEEFKNQFVVDRVNDWVEELTNLANMAKTDPHSALCAFTHGLRHKWSYTMRTIDGISELLKPLEECIHTKFIPSLIGKQVNQTERMLLSLPPRMGGLGIIDPSQICQTEYENSRLLTRQLQDFILKQSFGGEIDQTEMKKLKYQITKEREQRQTNKLEEVKTLLEDKPLKLRLLEAACERGASNWLNILPLESDGFALNKQEFTDAIRLRYGWSLDRVPMNCPCGSKFSVQHAMSCKKGGFVHARHNEVRDITAHLLSEVCNDVSVEPILQPLTGEQFRYRTANRSEEARLDVAARGFWARGQRTFCDVRVFDPSAPRLLTKPLSTAYAEHEQEKRRNYNQRVIQIEHGTFTPLVFSLFGGMSPECGRFYSRLSQLLSEKRKENQSITTSWVRARISFSLLRSALLCMRGSRSTKPQTETYETTIAFVAKEAKIV